MMRKLFVAYAVLVWMMLSGCASVKLGTIPRPAETSKLRVAVVPVSGTLGRGAWGKSSEEFASDQYKITGRLLDRLGYYEVVPAAEMKEVLGDYIPDAWRLTRKDAELARRIGTALFADYLLLAERGTAGDPFYYFEVTLINIDSGQRFTVRINNVRDRGGKKLPDGTGRAALRELFRDAKGDLLGTALRKTRSEKATATGQHPVEKVPAESGNSKADAKVDRHNPVSDQAAAKISRVVEYVEVEKEAVTQQGGVKRLIVYDLATTADIYRPVALILSEALREEIQKQGAYNMVNRENMQQLLDEMKLQQSGLIDSAQAVKLGKGTGAEEIVTGNLGALGRTVVLQTKRIEIQTMINLSLASLKSEAGQEEQLLLQLSKMVEQLMQNRK